MDPPAVGETFTTARTFTTEDVRRFADVTNDTQPIHTEPDEDGRLVVHGLLTGSLLTDIGGDLEVLARTMEFEFRRPVRTGERITCTWTVDSVEEREDRYTLGNDVVLADEDRETVATARVEGVVWKE
ncbi:MaoC family dehydratase [Salinirubellus sp. GCM10025818]|jgi:acyl dehydratase|uniref:MaoC family dehydratase n=1 Tax=Salinirubellus TaxID=2162630 RepID=UPI0030D063E9